LVAEETDSGFSASDGSLLISAARSAISSFLRARKVVVPAELLADPRFDQKLGCFVTLKLKTDHSLRGCIGFPEPSHKLHQALSMAAIYAATEDPRFPPVRSAELEHLLLEVSLLTQPEKVEVAPSERASVVKVGFDGLILRWPFGSGLLLPQVATEQDWNAKEFLQNLSLKAGANPDEWERPESILYKFHAHVFQETSPNGPVVLSK
jgi:uncharacterized protein (TIGR00296 family)